MAFKVRTTPDAEEDTLAILDWLIEHQAADAGLRWFLKMDEAISSLAELPNRCKLAPENEFFPVEIRELLYGQKPHVYRILFTIEGDTVVVLHVRHGRRETLTRN
jgi:plasmid stabilization system protein ParE